MKQFFPVGKVGANKTYTDKGACELAEGQECFDITGVDLETHDLVEQSFPVLDAEGNPVLDSITNEPMTELRKVFVVNVEKLALKTAKQIQEGKVQDRSAARQFCLGIIDEIAAINKDLDNPALMQTIFSSPGYQAIILALLTGATVTAKDLIVSSGPSLYPQGTVDALVAKMNAYIATES